MLATQDVQADEGRAVGEELKQVLHEVDVLLVRAAGLAGRYAGTNHYDVAGYVSPIDSIRFNCHLTSQAAGDLIAVGENLARMPESMQAVNQGEIGFAHLKAMARTAAAVGDRFEEAHLLEKARESSPGKFYYICHHYRHAADRKGFEAEQAEQVENRRLWVSKCEDGTVLLSATLDPEGGAAILTQLEPLARKSGAHDDGSREKRYADALVELVSGGGSQAQLQVTTSLETLRGLSGAAAADLELSAVPISAKTVERLACDSSIARILLDSESLVIDVGRSKRVVSEPGRRALAARDGHCRWPGCERPASWSAAHHVVHWIHGGTTDLNNLVLLCHRHHWMVHEGNWQIVRGDGQGLDQTSHCRTTAAAPFLNTYFWILPVAVFGSSCTNVTLCGALKWARRSRVYEISSGSVALAPAFKTT
jgi:hypothetical protein